MPEKIIQQIEKDIIQALRNKKEVEILTLRGVKSAIKNAEIAKKPDKLDESDIIRILRSEIKKRQDAKILYEQGKRSELADKEESEIKIIEKYLPQELSDEGLEKIIKDAIAKSGASGPQDFGRVMGLAMKEVAGRADGNRVGEIVKEILTKLT